MSKAPTEHLRRENHRIISLIPSATEIVAALGYGDRLVGRSHECDFPAVVRDLPACTRPKFDPAGSSAEVHARVSAVLAQALAVYDVDLATLERLAPTLVLTQAQCEVCAVSLADVERAVATLVKGHPQVLSLSPACLADVWNDCVRVGAALGVDAAPLVNSLRRRVDEIAERATTAHHQPSVVCVEWLDPLMAAGNWVPELVALAGGHDLLGRKGAHSGWIDFAAIAAADPEVIVFLPCGFDLARTRAEADALLAHPGWDELTAVRRGTVFAVDGNQYFNRPGPRLVDSLEILAEILHPERFAPHSEGEGWVRLIDQPEASM
jgi:iron complex transport system substrate-binding protein